MKRYTDKFKHAGNTKQIVTSHNVSKQQAINRLSDLEDKIERGELVEVVRCKDCKYFKESEITNRCFCTYHDDDVEMFKNDYCSYGERSGEK